MANLDSGFLILNEWIPALRSLEAEECKELLFALIDRQQHGTPVPKFNGLMGVFAQMIEPTIKRRLDGARGGASKGTTQVPPQVPTQVPCQVPTQVPTQGTSQASREEKSIYNTLSNERVNARAHAKRGTAFTPPTREEVWEYVESRGKKIDGDRFFDHYTANGWRVGKNPMKDWKAAVRNWEKSEGAFARSAEGGKGVSADSKGSFDTDDFFAAALARSYAKTEGLTNDNS